MSGASSIEWCDATWNPTRGCSRVSEGCRNCYAERIAARFAGLSLSDRALADGDAKPGPFSGFAERTKAGPRWTGRVELVPSALDWPLRWKGDKQARAEGRPSRIFVNSMSDLFHESLSDEAIAAVFGVMAAAPQHTFQILTKRPERMRRWFEWVERSGDPAGACLAAAFNSLDGKAADAIWNSGKIDPSDESSRPWPLPNVQLGTSAEDQATADERIQHLLATPAAVRFVSYEPALGPVDFGAFLKGSDAPPCAEAIYGILSTGGQWLDLIIVGGESGPGARPFDVAWARSVVRQCREAGVACFVKQLGARPVYNCSMPHGKCDHPLHLRDRKGGDWSEWSPDLRVREFPMVGKGR